MYKLLQFRRKLKQNNISYKNFDNYTGRVKKRCDLQRLVQNCIFFVQLSCMFFKYYFLKICKFNWYSNGPKKNRRTFFSLKIKSSEEQKCVNKLFLSKSKSF